MPSRNPYGCVFWPTYLLPFLGRDAAALVRLPLAARGAAACLRLAGAFVAACVSAAPAFAAGAAPASASTWISTWLVRLRIGVARPMAAAVKRLRVRPSFTTAHVTRSRSASQPALLRCARLSPV